MAKPTSRPAPKPSGGSTVQPGKGTQPVPRGTVRPPTGY